ncbi:MAG: ribonuclease E/G [Lachnospiraceae bacterium]|nr:ribonuclease E/G [Lachnospiraceae bacterium]
MKGHEKGKILILKLYNKLFSILICDNHILAIQVQNDESSDLSAESSIGNIYVGRVKNIAVNIGAAFVEIQKGEITFLPLEEAKTAIVINRKPDGTIKAGDELIVQLVKEPVKSKLAGVSAGLSLPGSYVVVKNRHENTAYGKDEKTEKIELSGNVEVSSKLGKKYHNKYKNLEPLKEIAKHFDIIVRTNAAGVEETSIVVSEAENLALQMEHILDIGNKRTCFSCLYQSENEYLKFIKNCYQSEYDEIITDEKEIYETLLADNRFDSSAVRYYEDDMLPLYKLYSIETRIKELMDKKVYLKSGAYLVIEQTEALTAIDVNTGKYEARKNQEETYLKINLEAAEAIAIALRARNLAGIILVDFINMKKKEHTEQLIDYMRSLLKKDSIPAQVVDITGLGLMEITRKKMNKSFAEQIKI